MAGRSRSKDPAAVAKARVSSSNGNNTSRGNAANASNNSGSVSPPLVGSTFPSPMDESNATRPRFVLLAMVMLLFVWYTSRELRWTPARGILARDRASVRKSLARWDEAVPVAARSSAARWWWRDAVGAHWAINITLGTTLLANPPNARALGSCVVADDHPVCSGSGVERDWRAFARRCAIECRDIARYDAGAARMVRTTSPPLWPVLRASPASSTPKSYMLEATSSAMLFLQLDGMQRCRVQMARTKRTLFDGQLNRGSVLRIPRGGRVNCTSLYSGTEWPSLSIHASPILRVTRGTVLQGFVERVFRVLDPPIRNVDGELLLSRAVSSLGAKGIGASPSSSSAGSLLNSASSSSSSSSTSPASSLTGCGPRPLEDVATFWERAVLPSATILASENRWFDVESRWENEALYDEVSRESVLRLVDMLVASVAHAPPSNQQRQGDNKHILDLRDACVMNATVALLTGGGANALHPPWWTQLVDSAFRELLGTRVHDTFGVLAGNSQEEHASSMSPSVSWPAFAAHWALDIMGL